MSRRAVFTAALAGLLAWTAYGCAVEVYRCGWIRWHDPYDEPSRWRFRSAHVEALRRFTDDLRGHLPEEEAVAVWSPRETPPEAFFRYLWLAYLLPGHDLRFTREDGGEGPSGAGYWIVLGDRAPDARWTLVVESGDGALYRRGLREGRE